MSLQFPKKEPFIFTWHITDRDTGIPIDDCDSVTATLYAGRDASNPDLIPGSAVTAFANKTLTHVSDSPPDGNYAVEIGSEGEFDPLPSTNYRVVIEATRDGEPFGHWEESAEVIVNS